MKSMLCRRLRVPWDMDKGCHPSFMIEGCGSIGSFSTALGCCGCLGQRYMGGPTRNGRAVCQSEWLVILM